MGTKCYVSQTQFLDDMVQKQKGIQKKQKEELLAMNIMDHGTFFEPAHRMIMEQEFATTITETSMIQGKGLLNGMHQSPDGLGVIATDRFKELVHIPDNWCDHSVFDKPFQTVLFEQKCPSYRTPIPGYVPEHYIG